MSRNRKAMLGVHYENDVDTFWSCCFCLFRDGNQGQVYENGEALLCHRDIRCRVLSDYGFGVLRREHLIPLR